MSKLKGKVAVVTGASKGIGAGIAKALAAEGASVTVNYSGDKAGADKVVAEIKAKGGNAIAVQGDVSKAADVKQLFDANAKAFGRLDVLVNNAGIYKFLPLEDSGADEFQRQFAVNVLGPLQVTREASSLFGPDGGSVINVSSIASRLGMPHSTIYAGTKGALDAMSYVMANELAGRKIRVNVVAPGMTESEGVQSSGMLDNLRQMAEEKTPLKRIGQPEDIAKVVVFLASDESGWLTGERINASGGYH